jgi:hypothetical protein
VRVTGLQERLHMKSRLIIAVPKFGSDGARAARKATVLSTVASGIAPHVLDACF